MLFKINLATKIHVNFRLVRICTLCALLLFSVALVYNVVTISSRFGETKSLTDKLAVMNERVKVANSKGITEKDYATLFPKIDFANAIIGKKTYNWLTLLDRLETVVPDGVAVVTVDPDPSTQMVKLSGVARNFKRLRQFLENMEDSRDFTEVFLVGEANAPLADGTPGVTFSLTCKAVNK